MRADEPDQRVAGERRASATRAGRAARAGGGILRAGGRIPRAGGRILWAGGQILRAGGRISWEGGCALMRAGLQVRARTALGAGLLVSLAGCGGTAGPDGAPSAPVPGGAADDPARPPVHVHGESPGPGVPAELDAFAREWVDGTLASLTLEAAVGQLVVEWIDGAHLPTSGPRFERVRRWVEEQGIGGLYLSIGTPHAYAAKVNQLQRLARVPLLFASDFEDGGPGMRISRSYALPSLLPQGGGTDFPPTMAVGATGDVRLAREYGRVTGEEARAVGIRLNFAPVLDVNSNPGNPVIGTRSFGGDPAMVARLGTAYVEGLRSAGVLATAKHFPGHGDTGLDSHLALPAVEADRARLDTLELVPFRAAVEAGVDAVMTAHVSLPAILGERGPPATLSPEVMTGLLREEMGFGGLLVTDALMMGAISDGWGAAEAAVRALEAGADILLSPGDVEGTVDAVVAAVREGRISEGRVRRSTRRVLEAKARAGLHRDRGVDVDRVAAVVGAASHRALSDTVAERSLVLVRDRRGEVPLPAAARTVVSVTFAAERDLLAGRFFDAALESGLGAGHRAVGGGAGEGGGAGGAVGEGAAGEDAAGEGVAGDGAARERAVGEAEAGEAEAGEGVAGEGPAVVRGFRLSPSSPPVAWAAASRALADADAVVVGLYRSPSAGTGLDALPSTLRSFVRRAAAFRPTVLVAFGSPWILAAFPGAPAFVAAWGAYEPSQRAAARGLLGETAITGRLPVAVPPHPIGHGLDRPAGVLPVVSTARRGPPPPPRSPTRAAPMGFVVADAVEADPREVGMDPAALERLDSLVLEALGDSAAPDAAPGVAQDVAPGVAADVAPGAALAVGRHGRLVRLRGYGTLDRDGATPVTPTTIYDLASLTKVVGTTTAVMILVQEGLLELDAPVVRYLPWWSGGHADKARVTVRQLLLHRAGLPAFRPWFLERAGEQAYRDAIAAEPLESEPGRETVYSDLGAMTLAFLVEERSGRRLDVFLRERVWSPLDMDDTAFLPDPSLLDRIAPTELDTLWRGVHLHGTVHDENADAVGGVAGHAGLFSTARDLSIFARMMLGGGVAPPCSPAVGSGVPCARPRADTVRVLEPDVLSLFTRRFDDASSRALGWDTPSGRSSAGEYFTSRAFGHTGFTGTSIWMDPELDLFVILLTNRVNPTRENTRHVPFRRAVHDLAARAIVDRPVPRREGGGEGSGGRR